MAGRPGGAGATGIWNDFLSVEKKNGANLPEFSKVSPKFYRGWLPIDGRAGKESKWEQ